MAKVGFWLKGSTGKLAGATMYKSNGETVMREVVTPQDAKTTGQLLQRVVMHTVISSYSLMKDICDHSFEGMKKGNNNPLNIRIGNKWKGLKTPNTDGAFDQFVSAQWGYRATFVILRNYIRKYKCDTVRKIISRFAPSSENNTEAYIKSLCKMTGLDSEKQLTAGYDDLSKLVYAMAYVESRVRPCTDVLRFSWSLI